MLLPLGSEKNDSWMARLAAPPKPRRPTLTPCWSIGRHMGEASIPSLRMATTIYSRLAASFTEMQLSQ